MLIECESEELTTTTTSITAIHPYLVMHCCLPSSSVIHCYSSLITSISVSSSNYQLRLSSDLVEACSSRRQCHGEEAAAAGGCLGSSGRHSLNYVYPQ